MNRAILIVICDFLVSAMLTMMTGMVPAHTGGTGVGLDENTTKLLLRDLDAQKAELEALRAKLRETVEKLGMTPEREAELRRLAERLAENQVQQQKLRESLSARPDNTGELSPEELQRRLNAAQIEKARLEIELKDSQRDLAVSREKAGDVSERLRDTTEQLRATSAELKGELQQIRSEASAQREELKTERRKHDETRAKLEQSQGEHAETKITLARAESELESQRRQHQDTKAEAKRLRDALGESRGDGEKKARENANLRGRLSEQQKVNADNRDKIVALERQLVNEQLKRARAEAYAEKAEETVKSVVTEISEMRAKEQTQMQEKAQTQARLEAAQKMLAEKGRPIDVALQSYSRSVVRIKCEVSEKAAFRDRVGRTESLYPVVDFGGRTVLVGLLNRFAGDEKVVLSFRNITKVDFSVSSPLGGTDPKPLVAMLLPKSEWRIAGFPYQDKNCTPLKLMTAEQLVRRGLNGLYIFKRTVSGSSALLTGRVSLVLNEGRRMLFVRNAGRTELKAEPGDVIVSSEGSFIGIAVAGGTVDGVRGVYVALFPRADVWNDVVTVPLDKGRYGVVMQNIRKKIRPAYDQR